MLGKRKPMRRTSSVALIGSGSVNGDSSPLAEHPKEKQKSSNYQSPGQSPGSCVSATRQVIGFQPKVFIDEEADLSLPTPPHRDSPRSNSKSPGGSPRSALGDLLSGSRPWDRKDEGVGLGIVVALSGSQEEVCKVREDGRGYPVPGASASGYGTRKTSPQAQPHSGFAPSRASPPIPIHAPFLCNSGHHSPSRCSDQNCCPLVSFGLAPSTFKEEIFLGVCNSHPSGGGASRPNNWSRPNAHSGGPAVNWGQHADMDVDRNEFYTISNHAHLVHTPRQNVPNLPTSTGFGQNFLDACHLCRRRLGEGRDIYIYRGDKAFCSPECRHQQILNDERPEQCAAAVMKVGGASDVRSTAQRSRVMAAGTATAAAA